MPPLKTPRNRTLRCSAGEYASLKRKLLVVNRAMSRSAVTNQVIHGDVFKIAAHLPGGFADLLFVDPPYNLSKNFNGRLFREKDGETYAAWFEHFLTAVRHTLKGGASVYVCADWKTSVLIAPVLHRHFYVRNRITWEREKGRGAKHNWKNNMEDIWFCTVGERYHFDVESVKLKRRVIAPYRNRDGSPKDWTENANGNYRLTHPSNLWTDISVPFWSMPENTDHPTQKPEKLLAKLLLASTKEGDVVFDPFAGSGTTAVVAKKFRRRYVAVEMDEEYCCWTQKRLRQAETDGRIQGYADGVFWERNTPASRMENGGNNAGRLL